MPERAQTSFPRQRRRQAGDVPQMPYPSHATPSRSVGHLDLGGAGRRGERSLDRDAPRGAIVAHGAVDAANTGANLPALSSAGHRGISALPELQYLSAAVVPRRSESCSRVVKLVHAGCGTDSDRFTCSDGRSPAAAGKWDPAARPGKDFSPSIFCLPCPALCRKYVMTVGWRAVPTLRRFTAGGRRGVIRPARSGGFCGRASSARCPAVARSGSCSSWSP